MLPEEFQKILFMINNPILCAYEPVGAYELASMIAYAVKNNLHITIDADFDPDGFFSGRIVCDILDALGHTRYTVVQTQEKRHGVDGATLLAVANNQSDLLIVLDSSSDLLDKLLEISNYCKVAVIDHHKPTKSVPPNTDRFVFVNSFLFEDSGFKSMSAGLATYLTLKPLIPSKILDLELASLAYASIITDSIAMDSHKLISFMEGTRKMNIMHPILHAFRNKFSGELSREFISFQVSPRLNACFRSSRISLVYDLFFRPNYRCYTTDSTLSAIDKVYKDTRGNTGKIRELARPQVQDNFILVELNSVAETMGMSNATMRMYTGLIANEFSKSTYKPCLAYVTGKSTIKGSVRDYLGRPLLNYFTNFIAAGGHPPAFGFEDSLNNFKVLSNKLKLISDKLPKLDKKDLKLDLPDNAFQDMDRLHEAITTYSQINELGTSVPNVYLNVKIPGNAVISNRQEISVAEVNGIAITSFSGYLFPNVAYTFKPTNNKLIR